MGTSLYRKIAYSPNTYFTDYSSHPRVITRKFCSLLHNLTFMHPRSSHPPMSAHTHTHSYIHMLAHAHTHPTHASVPAHIHTCQQGHARAHTIDLLLCLGAHSVFMSPCVSCPVSLTVQKSLNKPNLTKQTYLI